MATKKPPKERTKRSRRSVLSLIITLVVFVGLIGGVIIMTLFFPNALRGEVRLVKRQVPLITTTLTSKTDGTEHKLQALFVVYLDTKASNNVTQQILHDALTEIMNGVDVDAVAGPDGVYYVNQYATEELNAYLSDYTGMEAVVVDLYVGDRVVIEDIPQNDRNEMFERLKPN